MTELPAGDDHQMIRLGDTSAVVVPLEEYQRLREMERRAELADRVEAEEEAALTDYRESQRSGRVRTVPQDKVRQRLGLAR